MSTERRYSEREIAAIFEQATEAQEAAHRSLSHSEGLTLAELQQIGREAGITPALITRAAATIDRTTHSVTRERLLGLPVGVTRIVDLPGPLSNADWDRLVVDLRTTFQAPGEVRREGSLREWRNGNLHALVEPTVSGHRLHLRTRKGNAPSTLAGGMGFFAVGMTLVLIGLLTGKPVMDPEALVLALLAAIGLGSAGLTAFRLPRWASERERQMEAVAARAIERVEAPPTATPNVVPTETDALGLGQLPDGASAAPDQTARRSRT